MRVRDTETWWFMGETMSWSAEEAPESRLKLVNGRTRSAQRYNRNTVYSRVGKEWQVVKDPQALTGLERGHDYRLRSRLVGYSEQYLVTAPRIADQETESLVDGLGAWAYYGLRGVARKGMQGARWEVQAFGREFYLPADSVEEFRRRVEAIGGRVRIERVDLAELERIVGSFVQRVLQLKTLYQELESARKRVDQVSVLYPAYQVRIAEAVDCGKEAGRSARLARELTQELFDEYGREADKLRAKKLQAQCTAFGTWAIELWPQLVGLYYEAVEAWAARVE